MAQTLTFITLLAAAAVMVWYWRRYTPGPETVAVKLKLDRSAPGAHLMWDIANSGTTPITVTKLVIHTGTGESDGDETVRLGLPQELRATEHALLPMDVDWTVLSAKSMGVVDQEGREHAVSRGQLSAIQEQLRALIDRRVYTASARDWLFVGTDFAFGVIILGLGFFMLMWVIATG